MTVVICYQQPRIIPSPINYVKSNKSQSIQYQLCIDKLIPIANRDFFHLNTSSIMSSSSLGSLRFPCSDSFVLSKKVMIQKPHQFQKRQLRVTSAASRGFGQKEKESTSCPCGGLRYKDCCGRYHGGSLEPDALSLMKARYSAYAKGLGGYIARTTHADHPVFEISTKETIAKGVTLIDREFTKLEIELVEQGSNKNETYVTFKAKMIGRKDNEKFETGMYEKSRFVKEGKQWLYIGAEWLRPYSGTEEKETGLLN